MTANRYKISFEDEENILKLIVELFMTLKAIEFYILSGLIV